MLTKKKLRKWLNIAALVFVLATGVLLWALSSMAAEGKVAVTAALLAALRASWPSLKKEAAEAIEESDLPEDEAVTVPAKEPAK
jgi:hypothetical protein